MSGESTASASKLEIEQELRQMNDDWVKALVRADRVTLDRIMADDFCFAYPMEGDDKAQFIGDVVSGDVLVEKLTRENVSVRIWGDTAVLTGKDSSKLVIQRSRLQRTLQDCSHLFPAQQQLATSFRPSLPIS